MEFTQISWINMKNTIYQNYRKCLLSSTMRTSDMSPVELQLFFSKEFARIHNLPTQEFMVRNDMGCGSTIAPILASGTGVCTVDCGAGQAFHAQYKRNMRGRKYLTLNTSISWHFVKRFQA
ncbi:hypothetical protein Vadar_007886 [Vaccinium darrowii]|nr:hypothetical protein Vadar_007886 [Vaccinium darrowii]